MSRTPAELGRTPGAEELAARKQISQQKIRKARKLLAASRNSAPRNIAVPSIPLQTYSSFRLLTAGSFLQSVADFGGWKRSRA